MCEINLEAELFTLQDSNAKLVAALQEANSSVEQWKKQLAEYQEETDRLRDQVTLCSAQGVITVGLSWVFFSQCLKKFTLYFEDDTEDAFTVLGKTIGAWLTC